MQLLQMLELTYLKHLEKLPELWQGHMKYTYTGCLHFVSVKQLLHLIPHNNLENKTYQQKENRVKLHFDHPTEKLKIWGRGRNGKSSSLAPYLPNLAA